MPPQHSIHATPTYLHRSAFDLQRMVDERRRMPNDGDGHPLVLYFAGESRFDLDAQQPIPGETPDDEPRRACARDYLKPDHGCREWKFRRLRPVQVARCNDVGGNVGELQAFAAACGDKPLTDAEVDAFVDEYGLAAICEVGRAVLLSSTAPKASEKKL